MKKDIDIIKTKKKSISKENEKNKSLVDLYKTNYDTILKEKENLIKENLKLNNEIQIIKINNEKITNIKINNNFKAQNNLKLKETINNLTKEKKELENKYKNLQKNRSKSSINIISKKKFCNLSKIKNKSFIIYSINEIKKQNNRKYKKKKFNKLVIENKISLFFRQIINIKNKKTKINGYDYNKDINELKNKIEDNNKYIKALEKEKVDLKNSNDIQINKLKQTIKELKEKKENLKEDNDNKENNKLKDVIEQLEKDKNRINQAKIVEASQLRIEISKLKLQINNLNNELEKYKNKVNKEEFNDDDNEVHRLYI